MAGMADPRHPARTDAPRPPLWTRQFVLVGVTYFFVAMIFYSLMTAMAAYAALRFGADDAQAGLVVGAFVLGAVVTRVTTTPAATAWGRGRVLRAALVLYVLTSAAYLWADTLPALVAVRFLNGMCFGAAGTVLATAVQAIVPPTRRSEGTGWFSTAMTIAGAAGPVLAFQLAEGPGPARGSWRPWPGTTPSCTGGGRSRGGRPRDVCRQTGRPRAAGSARVRRSGHRRAGCRPMPRPR